MDAAAPCCGFCHASGRAILAAVDQNPKLARIRNLLKDLPGEAGGGQMYAWVDPGDADSMLEHVWGLIAEAMRSCSPGLIPADAGVSDAAREPPLAEVDEAAATELLSWLLSTGLVYAEQGKYARSRARDLSATLARMLGPGARWRTNYGTQDSWSPATPTRSMPLSLAQAPASSSPSSCGTRTERVPRRGPGHDSSSLSQLRSAGAL
jgi:hypothetical protein